MSETPRTSSALRSLSPGSRCALISPSGPPEPQLVDAGEALLRSWGLEPVRGPHVLDRHERASGYLAGSDEARTEDLSWAWTDPEIDAVFCVRGGYGAIRLLDHLDAEALVAASPKPLYGSSDITALHEYWQQRLGVPTWFTPMIATNDLQDSPGNIEALRSAVLGDRPWELASDTQTATLVAGEAPGEVTGGNLSLLAMSTGSHPSTQGRAAGRIVLLEEVHESPYRIDGLMQILLRSGYFEGAVGVGLGTWEDCGPLDEIRALMVELLAPLDVPVV
ncbi:MAG: LD-carboxypeptidase, partial [Actinobacteria bacterium]|nr:LD-carboxypeptidase [Actinomycetota bacterium]